MSSSRPITISSLTYLKPNDLAVLLLEPSSASKVAIIDVRDSDHIGGNIKGSTWIPVNQLDYKMPELLRTLKDKEKVIFHCMLSQQRGPSAALAYARAKRAGEEKEGKVTARYGVEDQMEGGLDNTKAKSDNEEKMDQDVCVLEGGFGMWQASYGEDERLTSDYVEDIWV